jgi:hypothetical protein
MRYRTPPSIVLLTGWFLACSAPPVRAIEVSDATVVDRTNWALVQGAVPESVLNWLKTGDWVIEARALKFDPAEYFEGFAPDSFSGNKDLYDLDADGGIIAVDTGRPPGTIVGIPFPSIDPADPKAAAKIMYNNHYMQYVLGDIRVEVHLMWFNRSGFEREAGCEWIQAAMDGWPGARDRGNPERIEKYATLFVRTPFDARGLAIMLWRYLDPKKYDSTFVYVPSLRKVRRVSPANRSNAIGSDATADDANGFDGKISSFAWRFVERREALVPWHDENPMPVVATDKGGWETTKTFKTTVYGYQKDGWQGAPWAATNLAWAKRPVYILEATPLDPSYNYGTHTLWIDAQTFSCNYKVIHDRGGSYWKTFLKGDAAWKSEDGRVRYLSAVGQQVVDDRADHASIIEGPGARNQWTASLAVDLNDFSLGGFQKLCK